jgi:hypothetical protein
MSYYTYLREFDKAEKSDASVSKVTPELLRELQSKYDRTTGRCWAVEHDTEGCVENMALVVEAGDPSDMVCDYMYAPNAEFIAAAHNAMPALIEYIRELEGRLQDYAQNRVTALASYGVLTDKYCEEEDDK